MTRICIARHNLNISKQEEGGTIVHTCSVHYNTCHKFRMMIHHGCYSALLASCLELLIDACKLMLYHYIITCPLEDLQAYVFCM